MERAAAERAAVGMETGGGEDQGGGARRRRRRSRRALAMGSRGGWCRLGVLSPCQRERAGVLSRWVAVVPPHARHERGECAVQPQLVQTSANDMLGIFTRPTAHTQTKELSREHNSLSHTEPRAVATELRGSRTSPPCRCRAPRRAPLLTGVARPAPRPHNTQPRSALCTHRARAACCGRPMDGGARALATVRGPSVRGCPPHAQPSCLWPKRHLCGGSVFTALSNAL